VDGKLLTQHAEKCGAIGVMCGAFNNRLTESVHTAAVAYALGTTIFLLGSRTMVLNQLNKQPRNTRKEDPGLGHLGVTAETRNQQALIGRTGTALDSLC